MEIRKIVGQVTPEERNEIQALFERKIGLWRGRPWDSDMRLFPAPGNTG